MTEAEAESAKMSNEEMAFLTKTLWEALQTPRWLKNDLIEFGMAIFSKKSLKAMDDKVFARIFPFLQQVAESMAEKLAEKANAVAAEFEAESVKEETGGVAVREDEEK